MAHVCCELRDVGQLSLLSRGPRIADLGNRESQRFVVCEKRERTPFQKVAEVSNSQIRSNEFTIERTVVLFSRPTFSAEKRYRFPVRAITVLFEDCSDCCTGSINCECGRLISMLMDEHSSLSESFLCGRESFIELVRPLQRHGFSSQRIIYRSHDVGRIRNEPMIKVQHPHELL